MPTGSALRSRTLLVIAVGLALAPLAATAQRGNGDATLARIRAEGLERSTALSLFLTLTDEIGARLTGSPAHVRSANWARNRRLAAAGQPVVMTVESRTQHHETDRNSYNVIAEIAGTDPAVRDEYVLIGAHLDSWHSANGATDNADGVVAVMEAMRILRAIGATPRRTIRVALWSGEEQGLLGARAHIERHLATPEAQAKLQVYLNDDPGSGRTLGFYM